MRSLARLSLSIVNLYDRRRRTQRQRMFRRSVGQALIGQTRKETFYIIHEFDRQVAGSVYYYYYYYYYYGPGQRSRHSVSLRARWSGDRITVGARFSAPVQTGPGDHPVSYTMGTGSFSGVKRPGRGVDHPRTAEVKGQVNQYICFPSGPSWRVLG